MSTWPHAWLDPLLVLTAAGLLGVAIVLVPIAIIEKSTGRPVRGFSGAERRLCDQAVEALLHSPDLVEVTRAAAIVREIPCSIGRRLP
jgi:hypothetical protein